MAAIRCESALVRIELASIGSDNNFVHLTSSQRVASGFRGGLCNSPPEPAQLTPHPVGLIQEMRNDFAPYVRQRKLRGLIYYNWIDEAEHLGVYRRCSLTEAGRLAIEPM